MKINCKYKDSCTDYETSFCNKCKHNKKSYFSPIGADLTTDLSEKDIPKKVLNNYTQGNHDMRYDGDCPSCKKDISNGLLHYPDPYKRCPHCGQALDWE